MALQVHHSQLRALKIQKYQLGPALCFTSLLLSGDGGELSPKIPTSASGTRKWKERTKGEIEGTFDEATSGPAAGHGALAWYMGRRQGHWQALSLGVVCCGPATTLHSTAFLSALISHPRSKR